MTSNKDILTLPHDQLESIQLAGIKQTLVNCYENIPFYKDSFDAAGFDPRSVQTLDDLARAPFTTKQDLRDNYPYGMLAVPLKDVREIHMSSGTTGVATVGAYTDRDLEIWGDCFARGVFYANGGENDVMHVCYGYGLFTGGLGAHYGGVAAGCTTIPMSAGNTERQIRVLREMGSTILCCTPSYAMHIADTAIAMGLDPAKDFHLRAGIHGAEAFSDNFRADLEKKLDYKVLDVYGLTETMGPGVAVECWEQNGLHLAEDHFFAEIINPETGERLPDGEWGELVITTLVKEGAPLIRFRTHDISRIIPGQCPCGCRYPRIDTIMGRSDDMMKIKGVNVFPKQIEEILAEFPDLSSEYQIRISHLDGRDTMRIYVETNGHVDFAEMSEAVAEAVKGKIGFTPIVKVVELGVLPRSEKKTKRVIDERFE